MTTAGDPVECSLSIFILQGTTDIAKSENIKMLIDNAAHGFPVTITRVNTTSGEMEHGTVLLRISGTLPADVDASVELTLKFSEDTKEQRGTIPSEKPVRISRWVKAAETKAVTLRGNW
jgi:hypothetical protein